MSKQNISNASKLYTGRGRYAPLLGINGRVGVPMSVLTKVNMGSPIVGDPNGYVETQNLTDAGIFSVDLTAVVAIAEATLVGIADVPRNVVASWSTNAVLTITGTDIYDEPISEESADATVFTGKKAFKTVTNISSDTTITALTVGTGNVLGIPYVLTDGSDILGFTFDGVEEAATSTFKYAVKDVATMTTGDVRGTVIADSTLDASPIVLWMHCIDNSTKQGLVGVTQA